jgi:hypothetical protein
MDIPAHRLNPNLLPQLMQELADVIGLDAALKLVKAYPGVSLYIPEHPHPDHAIAQSIGFDALCKLAKVYAQETLRLPKLDAAVRQIRHQVIADMLDRNCSTRAIALATGYTARRVEQLRSGQLPDLRQNDLFKD